MRTRWLKTVAVLLGVIWVTGCQVSPPLIEQPKQPPSLQTTTLPEREEVIRYQDELFNYIRYLEQYYITLGVYYNGHRTLPVNDTVKQSMACKVIQDVFKPITLPPPPKPVLHSSDKVIHELIDHIVHLRDLIRKNNRYMESLKEKYKACK